MNERTKAWQELYPEVDSDDILSVVKDHWDFSYPLPLPKFTQLCVCGSTKWHARLWLFWDRTDGGVLEHRIKMRCDTSFKCMKCGQVVIYGVPCPPEWVEFWEPQLDVQIDLRTGRRIFEEVDRRVASGDLELYDQS